MRRVVVVGAGHAGVQVVDSLRVQGFEGKLTLVSAENDLPYQRPPLSKDALVAGAPDEALPLRAASFYEQGGVDLVLGEEVVEIDRSAGTVGLRHGGRLPYDRLVLATGGRARVHALAGRETLTGVHALRTLDDARSLQLRLTGTDPIVVVGAGFIGLEVAAAARAHGREVTVVAPHRPLYPKVSGEVSAYVERAYRDLGVDLRTGITVTRLEGRGGALTKVELSDGRTVPTSLLVVGIGIEARAGLAAAAGLGSDAGVLVDEMLATADPTIFAVGDCVRFPSLHAGRTLRVESVQNAVDQGRYVADRLLGRATAAYDALPWFWSHLGPERLNIAGIADVADRTVVRGDVGAGHFSAFRFREDRLVAVESVNKNRDHLAARRLLASPRRVTPDECADPSFDLRAAALAGVG